MSSFFLPETPVRHVDFIPFLAKNPKASLLELVTPFTKYESKLREGFAQYRDDPTLADPLVNAVPIYDGHEDTIRIRARSTEDEVMNSKYVMALSPETRKQDGDPAVVTSFKQFKQNLDLFSESSLVDLDWSNVVMAGSAVVTSLLPVPEKHGVSKRALRQYYHEQLAPSSDVDLFIWGLDEAAAVKKIQQIETRIRDSILSETTTIRTKNAITIASQYPIRHVQIVLRLYKNISEILTGFDVDSSCFAYNGSQIYGTPRGIAAFMTQSNTVDLSRRSPSYESRLAKYAKRGFEIYCPILDRDRVDPTIFERSFVRTMGLARLLVLERLPNVSDREAYLTQRRAEQGRPPPNTNNPYRRPAWGDMKDKDPEDIAEWDLQGDVSNYHTFTVPYGPKITPKKIERLLFSKDLLLNAEWNVKKDRNNINLHRHPCFIGEASFVIHDCCGECPKPTTDEERELAAEEAKHYVSGELEFMKDDPGRQAIGSFNPITTDDWLEMAYIGQVEDLCNAIAEKNLSFVQKWCRDGVDHIDRRDHTGRTPLQLAVQTSSIEIVRCLIDAGARIFSRVADGTTALHMAAARGQVDMVTALLEKSEENEEADDEKKSKRRKTGNIASQVGCSQQENQAQADDVTMVDADNGRDDATDEDSAEYKSSKAADAMSMTQGSFVKLKSQNDLQQEQALEAEQNEPDVYDVNIVAWDAPVSALHLAILFGHTEVVEVLIDRFGADGLLPVKLLHLHNKSPRAAILTLVLAAMHAEPESTKIAKGLLDRGATSAQADLKQLSALHYVTAMRKVNMLKMMFSNDGPAAKSALSYVTIEGYEHRPTVRTPLMTAIGTKDESLIEVILDAGASAKITLESFTKAFTSKFGKESDNVFNASLKPDNMKSSWETGFEQPVIQAVENDLFATARLLIEKGASVNTLTVNGNCVLAKSEGYRGHQYRKATIGTTLLDLVDEKMMEVEKHTMPYRYNTPIELKDDEYYLKQAQPGTYEHWQLHAQLQVAKSIISRWHEDRDAAATLDQQSPKKMAHRQAAQDLIQRMKDFRHYLMQRGAKTFEELHSFSSDESKQKAPFDQTRKSGLPPTPDFCPQITFHVPELTDTLRERYIRLFEAVWCGDEQLVKDLTLREDGDQAPLTIAVYDSRGFSPFSLAIGRGRQRLAKLVLEIATVQYEPDHDDKPRRRYVIASGSDTDSDSEDESRPLKLSSELVDDKFTINDIAQLQTSFGSKVKPASMLSWPARFWMLFESKPFLPTIPGVTRFTEDSKRTFKDCFDRYLGQGSPLLDACIVDGNLPSVKLVLQTLLETCKEPSPDHMLDYAIRCITTGESVKLALKHGHFHVANELIRSAGSGLLLDELLMDSGIKDEEKPKYYQGLKIKGQLKKDWAQERHGRHYSSRRAYWGTSTLLLESARMGQVASVRWALSDVPRHLYYEFGKNAANDKRVQLLSEAKGGFEKVVDDWYDKRASIAIHCALLADNDNREEKLKTIKYLIEAMPASIETKSVSGHTPLSLAFSLMDVDAIELLLGAHADQTVRDGKGRNLVHLAMCSKENRASHKPEDIEKALSLLDARLVPDMLLDRCSDGPTGLTPLARWINRVAAKRFPGEADGDDPHPVEAYNVLRKYMSGDELKTMDGSGQLVMHQLVKAESAVGHALLKVVFEQDPGLAFVENSTGQTPVELAESLYVREKIADPPDTSTTAPPMLDLMSGEKTLERAESPCVENWKLCREIAARHTEMKRTLVSVPQATEVAKRLATATKQRASEVRRGRDGYYPATGEEVGDEVDRWSLYESSIGLFPANYANPGYRLGRR